MTEHKFSEKRPDDGTHQALSANKAEELYLLARILTKTWPVQAVFEELEKENE